MATIAKKRIALILSGDRPLSTYPSVINTAVLLNRHGYQVDILISEATTIDIPLSEIEIRSFKHTTNPLTGSFFSLLKRRIRYDLVIAFHINDFLGAAIWGELFRRPYIYFSLEIIAFDKINEVVMLLKKYAEIFFNRRAVCSVVQDGDRKKILAIANRIKSEKIICVPNSYIGLNKDKSDYLRKKFNLPRSQTILLYAGAIADWAITDKLIEHIVLNNENVAFIIHGFSLNGYLEKITPRIEAINRQRRSILLSLDILPDEEYHQMISSADIGIVWYRKEQPLNMSAIGKSSGKLGAFLRSGIPVILPSYFREFEELTQKYFIGVSTDDEKNIPEAIKTLLSNYQEFRHNAFACYEEEFDFAKYFTQLLKVIQENIPN